MSAMIPVAEAVERMLERVTRVVQTEIVPLAQGLGRICAKPIQSPIDVPGHDNSAMDGYAVRAGSAQVGDQPMIVGTSAAGHPYSGAVAAGQCVRIMTGATGPTGTDAIIIQENVSVSDDGGSITINEPVRVGDNIRLRGADVSQGATVIGQGERLNPVDIGLLASLGIAEVEVQRTLKVAVFSTGDELVSPGQPLQSGQIYDSNRYLIGAMLQRLNIEVMDLGRLPDNLEAIKGALTDASAQADAIITSGGVSVGDADYTKQALEALGEVGFWKVAMKPGKPFAFGRLNQAWFFGLPGNPVAAAVTMDQLVQPVLAKLAGEQQQATLQLSATSAEALKKRPGRADFQRICYWQDEHGELKLKSAGSQSSGVLSTLKLANGFAAIEQERGKVEPGESVTVLPFSKLLR